MPKIRKNRKTESCLNCGRKLAEEDNFCANCGQKNQDNYVSAYRLIADFFTNYFSLDSRFGRTFKPFFTKPGFVTEEFVQGRRVQYAHPVRWYLVFSVLHFFFLSFVYERNENLEMVKVSGNEDRNTISFQNSDEWDSLSAEEHLKAALEIVPHPDSSYTIPYEAISRLEEHTELTQTQIYDTLQLDRGTFKERIIGSQMIKFGRLRVQDINREIVRNLSIIAFFLLPVYAFILKIFFWRKGLYIKHLIHSLHIHAFVWILLTISYIPVLFFDYKGPLFFLITFGLLFFYLIISCRRLYQQRYFILITKLFGIGFIYFFSVLIVFLAGTAISVILM
jgi:hypothetical protein